MLLSRTLPGWGRVYFPFGGGIQTQALLEEIPEYFHPSITLRPGDVVFDVGANVGTFALGAAALAGGGLSFHCFEPILAIHAALTKNFETNALLRDSRATLHRCGLTARGRPSSAIFHTFRMLPCDTTQHIDEKRREFAHYFIGLGKSVRAKLLGGRPGYVRRRLAGMLGPMVERFLGGIPTWWISRTLFEAAIGTSRRVCPMQTLSDVVERERPSRIDLLKIDVEGAEFEVLLGVADETWPLVRQVVLEGVDVDGRLAAIATLLRARGFLDLHVETSTTASSRGLTNFVLHARRPADSVRPEGRASSAMTFALESAHRGELVHQTEAGDSASTGSRSSRSHWKYACDENFERSRGLENPR